MCHHLSWLDKQQPAVLRLAGMQLQHLVGVHE